MAIYCYKCGKQHPDDANFCMGCGQPFKVGGQPAQTTPRRWEYKDIVIQFPRDKFGNVNITRRRNREEAIRLGDSIILAYLQQEGRNGWQAEGPTDFRTLDQLNLIQKRCWFVINDRCTYEQVTIRLKRLTA